MVAMNSPKTIRIAAAVLNRPDGRTLLVRKRGTVAFMQPGGKIEPAEAAIAALCRELFEELGLVVKLDDPRYLGRFVAPAANEAGWLVDAEMFQLAVDGTTTPAAEIEEISWVNPLAPGQLTLASLTRDYILPLCCEVGASRISICERVV